MKFSRLILLFLLVISLFSSLFPEDFYKKVSLGIESNGSIYVLIPFGNFFHFKAGYPWTGLGFDKNFEKNFLPSLEGKFELNLSNPTSNFLGEFFLKTEYQNIGLKSGIEVRFLDFSEEEKGRFYYVVGPYFEISNFRIGIDFKYHFLSAVYDENDAFYYNWPSPISDDLMSMSTVDFNLSYTLFGNKFGSEVNLKLFGGYKLGLAWSSYLSEALYRLSGFYFGVVFGI